MSTNEPARVELTDKSNVQADDASHEEANGLGRGKWELEKRYAPLVVIAIIAVLMALLVPA